MRINGSIYLIIGLVIGSLASVTLVAYINKQSKHKNKKKLMKRGGPSSGSPLTGITLDEEKSAWLLCDKYMD